MKWKKDVDNEDLNMPYGAKAKQNADTSPDPELNIRPGPIYAAHKFEAGTGMDRGYIRLWRKITDCKALQEPNKRYSKLEAWIHLVLVEARGLPGNGLERGEFQASIRHLARKWQWPIGTVHRFLRRLQREGMIEKAAPNPEHLVEHLVEHQMEHFIICNYETYNPMRNGEWNTERNTEWNNIKEGLKKAKRKENTPGPPAPEAPEPGSAVLFEIYQSENKNLPEVKRTEERMKKCRARINQALRKGCLSQYLEDFRKAVQDAQLIPFLSGKGERKWRANFDWFVANGTNLYGVLEGKYGQPEPDWRTVGQAEPEPEQEPKTPEDVEARAKYQAEMARRHQELFGPLED